MPIMYNNKKTIIFNNQFNQILKNLVIIMLLQSFYLSSTIEKIRKSLQLQNAFSC